MTKCIIYCRESKSTCINSNSIKKQEKTCKKYCKKNNIKIKRTHKFHNQSARLSKNKQTLINSTKTMSSGDVLIVARVDRFSRDYKSGLKFLEELKEKNINVYSIKENINYFDNKTEFKKLLKLAQKYSDDISQYILNANSFLRKRGFYFGRIPFGYKSYFQNKIRKITRNYDEQKIISYINKNVDKGAPYKYISKKLNKKKLLFRGKFWTFQKVGYVYRYHIKRNKLLRNSLSSLK
jgi:DNA invertase Pin-like site-specific DNA recombinase